MKNYRKLHALEHRDRTDFKVKLRGGDPRSLKVKCVCGPCNHGWLGDIQEGAKPSMLRLAQGKWWTLNAETQTKLAAWVANGAIVSEFDTPENVSIPKADRDYLKANCEPPKDTWRIWLGRFSHPRWPGFSAHFPIQVLDNDDELEELPDGQFPTYNSVSGSYLVGQTFIHVMRCPFPTIISGWRFPVRIEHRLVQIWPIINPIIVWPPTDVLAEEDVINTAHFFLRFSTASARARRG